MASRRVYAMCVSHTNVQLQVPKRGPTEYSRIPEVSPNAVLAARTSGERPLCLPTSPAARDATRNTIKKTVLLLSALWRCTFE